MQALQGLRMACMQKHCPDTTVSNITHRAAFGAIISRRAFGSRGSSSTRGASLSLLPSFSFRSLWRKRLWFSSQSPLGAHVEPEMCWLIGPSMDSLLPLTGSSFPASPGFQDGDGCCSCFLFSIAPPYATQGRHRALPFSNLQGLGSALLGLATLSHHGSVVCSTAGP